MEWDNRQIQQPTKVKLERPEYSITLESATHDPIRLANSALRAWAGMLLAPYDADIKVRYSITYRDGKVLQGWYILSREDYAPDTKDVLGKHITRKYGIQAGLVKPEHLTEQEYQDRVANAYVWNKNKDQAELVRDRALAWLKGYRTWAQLL